MDFAGRHAAAAPPLEPPQSAPPSTSAAAAAAVPEEPEYTNRYHVPEEPEATFFFLPLLLATAAGKLSSFNFNPPFVDNTIRHPPGPAIAQAFKQPEYTTAYGGTWQLVSENAGVSAMHMAVSHNNKAIMFDDTNLGPSMIQLPPGKCRPVPDGKPGEVDCFAHAIEFDPDTAKIRPLRVLTDTWCSSGGFGADGTLVQTGGWKDGERAVRYIGTCDTCDWTEYPTDLSGMRWYDCGHYYV